MKFLFHTIITFDSIPVYYNVFKNRDHYFLQILHNPQKVNEAKSFTLKKENGEWKCSVEMSERAVQVIGEQIEAMGERK